jgi:uncharacterized membrane protein
MSHASFEASVDVEAPAKVVYDYIADFPRHVEWNYQPTEMVPVTGGPVRVGSQYQTTERTPSNASFGTKAMFAVMGPLTKVMWGSKGYTLAEITALEPNKRVAWKARAPSTKKGDLMRMQWELRLEEQNGTTKVVQHCDIVPPAESPTYNMINENTARQGREEATTNLMRMKSIVEGR